MVYHYYPMAFHGPCDHVQMAPAVIPAGAQKTFKQLVREAPWPSSPNLIIAMAAMAAMAAMENDRLRISRLN